LKTDFKSLCLVQTRHDDRKLNQIFFGYHNRRDLQADYLIG
jgi:hypothetical protein